MIHSPLGSKYAIGGALGRSIKRAAAGGWWLSGGIAAANCIAAYQPKGAASYAVSKVNLAQPGTYDATDHTSYPTWNATDGWIFSTQYLLTGINPSSLTLKSMIIRFSGGATSGYISLMGSANGGLRFMLLNAYNGAHAYGFGNGGLLATGAALASGVMAFSTVNCYLNGSGDGTITYTNASLPSVNIIIGGRNNNGTFDLPYIGKIQALAIYTSELSAGNVSALTTAMNAL